VLASCVRVRGIDTRSGFVTVRYKKVRKGKPANFMKDSSHRTAAALEQATEGPPGTHWESMMKNVESEEQLQRVATLAAASSG